MKLLSRREDEYILRESANVFVQLDIPVDFTRVFPSMGNWYRFE